MSEPDYSHKAFDEWCGRSKALADVSRAVKERVATLIVEEIVGCEMDPQDPFTIGLRTFAYQLRKESKPEPKPKVEVLTTPAGQYLAPEKPHLTRKYPAKQRKWVNGPLANPAPIPPWFGGSELEEKKPDHIADNLLAVIELSDPREDL